MDVCASVSWADPRSCCHCSIQNTSELGEGLRGLFRHPNSHSFTHKEKIINAPGMGRGLALSIRMVIV